MGLLCVQTRSILVSYLGVKNEVKGGDRRRGGKNEREEEGKK
jgi:hypothetical protein